MPELSLRLGRRGGWTPPHFQEDSRREKARKREAKGTAYCQSPLQGDLRTLEMQHPQQHQRYWGQLSRPLNQSLHHPPHLVLWGRWVPKVPNPKPALQGKERRIVGLGGAGEMTVSD